MAAAAASTGSLPSLTASKKLVRWAWVTLGVGGVPMAIAGQLTSPYLWALAIGLSMVILYAVHNVSPDLARERYRPPTPGVDGRWLPWVRLIAFAALLIALLDSGRWHWSAPMPPAWRIAGLAALLIGISQFVYAMSVNRFFSSVVRIQDDRGHHLIDRGPYAYVRHPGYVGMLLACAALPLALGSFWALAPVSLLVASGLCRVGLEDRFLATNLPGYPEVRSPREVPAGSRHLVGAPRHRWAVEQPAMADGTRAPTARDVQRSGCLSFAAPLTCHPEVA